MGNAFDPVLREMYAKYEASISTSKIINASRKSGKTADNINIRQAYMTQKNKEIAIVLGMN
jgi:hypothetical protein